MGSVITSTVLGLCAIVLFMIGISQYRSKTPVAFYSGEKPPDASQLTDVRAWNRKHGVMWMLYGTGFVLTVLCGFWMGESLWFLLPWVLFVIAPVAVMPLYHRHLVKKYRIQ